MSAAKRGMNAELSDYPQDPDISHLPVAEIPAVASIIFGPPGAAPTHRKRGNYAKQRRPSRHP